MSGTFSGLGIKQRTKRFLPSWSLLVLSGGVTTYIFENYKCYRQKQVGDREAGRYWMMEKDLMRKVTLKTDLKVVRDQVKKRKFYAREQSGEAPW